MSSSARLALQAACCAAIASFSFLFPATSCVLLTDLKKSVTNFWVVGLRGARPAPARAIARTLPAALGLPAAPPRAVGDCREAGERWRELEWREAIGTPVEWNSNDLRLSEQLQKFRYCLAPQ